MSTYEWDLYMTQWHGIDNTQHAFLRFDKAGLSENESRTADNVVLRSYEIADELVGDIVRATKKSNKGEEVYTLVISDHGHVMGKRRFFINSYLYQNGLIKLKRDTITQKITVDWENTQAFAQGMISVYINLKGRDPNGCVAPGKEYEETVDRIIGLLYDLKDPKTGMRPISLALSNRQAEVLGLSGERVGDVVFAANPVYAGDTRLELKEGLFADLKVGLYGGSIHGAQLPTVDLGEYGTIKSMFIVQGPKIKKSYVREKPINIVDVAPTISHMLNIPPPKDSEGKIMYDLFE
jgi:predicted AlkP superfamily phosphohydrolase/phosphomutase